GAQAGREGVVVGKGQRRGGRRHPAGADALAGEAGQGGGVRRVDAVGVEAVGRDQEDAVGRGGRGARRGGGRGPARAGREGGKGGGGQPGRAGRAMVHGRR